MKRTRWTLIVAALAAGSLARAAVPMPDFIDRAISAAGGQANLAAHPTLEWQGKAVIHLADRDIGITGVWHVTPPDRAAVMTFETAQGPSDIRTLQLDGKTGWLIRGDERWPMPPAVFAEEKHQFYLYSLLRVLPVRDAGVRLTPVPPDKDGQKGWTVETPGRLPVTLYFGSDARIVTLRTTFATADGTPGDRQEIHLSGTLEDAGMRWFQRMQILRNDKPYFDLDVTSFKAIN